MTSSRDSHSTDTSIGSQIADMMPIKVRGGAVRRPPGYQVNRDFCFFFQFEFKKKFDFLFIFLNLFLEFFKFIFLNFLFDFKKNRF